ncbi:MAG: cob(I)yrinic acid a,c-diamide adenosyltransferase [Ornithinimicrobium sp.]|uniref:cob(I)yrinic acid a,c-diamide adenosyltransferase n=1 Tax=Ornithinimicrobium sp. TaxID=1977084 RepID=UPI0026DEE860|nr:cob(I)yrinic acid a,c-diamide adenosyltransferase [Ornithinimicrobium sp.]MDO5740299.1 cob(I)yrinic acid a,c-diamide adenosyltransferase [Ornithinimicrobium sp.]
MTNVPEQDAPQQPPEAPPAKDHTEPRTKRPYDKAQLRSVPSLVLVATGHGKGKSTAAFGTMLRSRGRDWPTAVVQFLKSGKWRTGEEAMLRTLGVEWFSAGDGFSWESTDLEESRAKAVAAWKFSRELIEAGAHRMVMLDEISYPMNWGWIDTEEVARTLRERPEDVSVFLTGREMPSPIIDVADTVTEMVPVKHAFEQGIRARRGIDY